MDIFSSFAEIEILAIHIFCYRLDPELFIILGNEDSFGKRLSQAIQEVSLGIIFSQHIASFVIPPCPFSTALL